MAAVRACVCVCLLFISGIWGCSNAQSAADLAVADDRQDAKNHTCILPEPLANGKFWPHPRRCPPSDMTAACQLVPGATIPHWWILFYKCDAGYHLSKSFLASNCNNGTWVPALPYCVPDNCMVPVLPHHKFFLVPCASGECSLTPGQNVTDGTFISVSCENGFHLKQHSSNEIITICSEGKWKIFIPDCVVVPVNTVITMDKTTFPVDSNISIPCDVEGYPEPKVQWYKDNQLLHTSEKIQISDRNRLTVIQASVSDNGTYKCEAANPYSSSSSEVIISVEGVYVDPLCSDNLYFADCHLVVHGKVCTNAYYGKFCCKSCTLAGQLLSIGPHLQRQRRSLVFH